MWQLQTAGAAVVLVLTTRPPAAPQRPEVNTTHLRLARLILDSTEHAVATHGLVRRVRRQATIDRREAEFGADPIVRLRSCRMRRFAGTKSGLVVQIEGSRRRGRTKLRWMDLFKEDSYETKQNTPRVGFRQRELFQSDSKCQPYPGNDGKVRKVREMFPRIKIARIKTSWREFFLNEITVSAHIYERRWPVT